MAKWAVTGAERRSPPFSHIGDILDNGIIIFEDTAQGLGKIGGHLDSPFRPLLQFVAPYLDGEVPAIVDWGDGKIQAEFPWSRPSGIVKSS